MRWGFAVAHVHQAVHVWWGDADRLVRRANTDYLAAVLPRSILTIYPGEGDLLPISHWGEMLAALE